MVLPLNLAVTAAEISAIGTFPGNIAWMACHFSPYTEGITNVPSSLPAGSMLILNDRFPCQGHSPDLVAGQLAEAAERLGCESVLLDFQRPCDAESMAVVRAVLDKLPCPAAVSDGFAAGTDGPVFLPPAPLHIPLSEHIAPWQGREIWLEAALCREEVSITQEGAVFTPRFPPDIPEGGFFDNALCCHYRTAVSENEIRFTLFDTRESLQRKLDLAQSLGVKRAVGLFQELGTK